MTDLTFTIVIFFLNKIKYFAIYKYIAVELLHHLAFFVV